MLIPGNSGFKVEFGTGRDKSWVIKSAPNYGMADRLTRQMRKQIHQRHAIRLPANVGIPYAEQRGWDTWLISRVEGVHIFELGNDEERLAAFDTLMALVGCYVVKSQLTTVLPSVFKDKVALVAATAQENHVLLARDLAKEAQAVIAEIGVRLSLMRAPLLMGPCHGDLTFGNVLFDRVDRAWVFDFLDPFLESPLMDLVKLRQDTLAHWTWNHTEWAGKVPPYDCIAEMDAKLLGYVRQRSWAREWFPVMSALNFARVFQYSKTNDELGSLIGYAKGELCLTF